jgi:DNA-binding transcriptional ArsR family regulator
VTKQRKRKSINPANSVSATKCAERLKAVADPDRLRIVDCLRMGELTVGDISAILPMEIANVSHHLGVLRVNDIVRVEKQGRHRVYSLNPDLVGDLKASTLNFGCCRLEIDQAWKPASDRAGK